MPYVKSRPGAKLGRKREFEITDEILQQVEALGGRGLTQIQICDYFGISQFTWTNRAKETPELKLAFKRGKSKQIAKVSGKLIEQINGGSVPATIFYLKTQAGWRDESLHENEHKESDAVPNMTINVNDPIEAAKLYQEFMRKPKT